MSNYYLFIHVNEFAPPESPDTIPISQAYQLACLQKHGYSGRILGDYQTKQLAPADLRRVMQEHSPAVVGFAVYEENINRVRVLARYVKTLNPSTRVIFGGPQITYMPDKGFLQMSEVDILCRGEGEMVMLSLALAVKEGRPLGDVAGISFKEGGRIVTTESPEVPDDLDAYPSPYLEDLVDLAGKSRVILFSSRGCTSPCTFCYTTRASRKKMRFFSLDRVIAEMLHLKSQGITDFWFADPNFAFSRERLETFLSRIIEEVPGISFWCQTRYNLIDAVLLDLLQRAGAHTIAFGLESAHSEVLGRIRKGLDPEKISRAIRLMQEAGINVELFTMFGLPGETFEMARKTLFFVKKNNVAVEGNSISQQLHLFFGTQISDNLAENGIHSDPVTKPSYQCICRDFSTDSMTKDEIKAMSLLWRLNRSDLVEDVQSGINLIERAGFIISNHDALSCRPEADLLLARIFMALEEYGPACDCMDRLKEGFPENAEVRKFLSGPFLGHKIKRRAAAGPGSKIIYDCKGLLDGKEHPATVALYQEAVLGDGRLLPDFEKGVLGVKAGRWSQFEVVFPDDYGHPDLAGRKVLFQAYLHLAMDPVVMETPEEVRERQPTNIYRLTDLYALRKNNENLYYLVLRDSVLRGPETVTDYIKFLSFNVKLGFVEKALLMVKGLQEGTELMDHAGRIFLANGGADKAYEFLSKGTDTQENQINRIKALIELGRYEEAEEMTSSSSLDSSSVQALDIRVGLATLQQLPVKIYLERMNALLDNQIRSMEMS